MGFSEGANVEPCQPGFHLGDSSRIRDLPRAANFYSGHFEWHCPKYAQLSIAVSAIVIAIPGGLPVKLGDEVIAGVGVSGSPGVDEPCVHVRLGPDQQGAGRSIVPHSSQIEIPVELVRGGINRALPVFWGCARRRRGCSAAAAATMARAAAVFPLPRRRPRQLWLAWPGAPTGFGSV